MKTVLPMKRATQKKHHQGCSFCSPAIPGTKRSTAITDNPPPVRLNDRSAEKQWNRILSVGAGQPHQPRHIDARSRHEAEVDEKEVHAHITTKTRMDDKVLEKSHESLLFNISSYFLRYFSRGDLRCTHRPPASHQKPPRPFPRVHRNDVVFRRKLAFVPALPPTASPPPASQAP